MGLIIQKGFEHRDGNDMKAKAHQYRNLPNDEQETFFNEHGQRWFAFARLPYFDPSKMFVIDPMHNLLLGKYQPTYP